MSSLGPFMGMMGGGAPGGAQQEAQAAPVEVKEEAPKEKTHYDIELTSFDAATKVKLIKEIRAILNLGLKEAKETVESAPCWIQKEMAKEAADELKAKLEAVGGVIRYA